MQKIDFFFELRTSGWHLYYHAAAMELWNPGIELMSREDMRALQLEKLKRQLERVYTQSPYYKAKFDKARVDPAKLTSLDDIRHFPFFDKEEERASQHASKEQFKNPLGMHVTCDPKKVIRISSTSGTTGSPTFTGYTQKDREAVNETGSRCFWRMGARPGDVVLHAFVLSMWIAGTPVVDLIQNFGATVVPIGATSGLPRFAQIAQEVFPKMLICTPSYAEYLIEKLPEKAGVHAKDLGIEKIMVAGEPGAGNPKNPRAHRARLRRGHPLRHHRCDRLRVPRGVLVRALRGDALRRRGLHARRDCRPENTRAAAVRQRRRGRDRLHRARKRVRSAHPLARQGRGPGVHRAGEERASGLPLHYQRQSR